MSSEPQFTVTRAGDQRKADPMARGQDMRKKEDAQLVIELAKVKGKKVTKVLGIDDFGVDAAAAAKLFSKKCACGAASQKGKNGEPGLSYEGKGWRLVKHGDRMLHNVRTGLWSLCFDFGSPQSLSQQHMQISRPWGN